MNIDVEIVKKMGSKYIYLDTVSFLYLDEFRSEIDPLEKLKFNTYRTRFRNALNKCVLLGVCKSYYVGLSAYQTGDTLGGKRCKSYDFSQYKPNT